VSNGKGVMGRKERGEKGKSHERLNLASSAVSTLAVRKPPDVVDRDQVTHLP